jgi:hypothetical protein
MGTSVSPCVVDLQRSIGNLGQLTDMGQTAVYAKQMQEMEKDLKVRRCSLNR